MKRVMLFTDKTIATLPFYHQVLNTLRDDGVDVVV